MSQRRTGPSHGKLFPVPHLVIIVDAGGMPTKGRCSSCKDVLFAIGVDTGAAQEHFSSLEKQFREHCRKVHKNTSHDQSYPVQ